MKHKGLASPMKVVAGQERSNAAFSAFSNCWSSGGESVPTCFVSFARSNVVT